MGIDRSFDDDRGAKRGGAVDNFWRLPIIFFRVGKVGKVAQKNAKPEKKKGQLYFERIALLVIVRNHKRIDGQTLPRWTEFAD